MKDHKTVVLVNSQHNHWLLEQYGYQKWEPSEQEITIAQDILSTAIKDGIFDFLKKPVKESFHEYYKQYIPYLTKEGENVIEINAFCEILELPPAPRSTSTQWTTMDWKKEYVMVDDGGNCYWQITVSITKKTYKNLQVNGEG
ncbi:hypothetical protein [Aquimarina brevivitae]|uniref:hypothetical protein n=1 Tax=Aquimarina brevivitae TaxID=323412 RepID=UPI0013EEBBA3|nr:hypothetical protein [Aquimarina brevivitae]